MIVPIIARKAVGPWAAAAAATLLAVSPTAIRYSSEVKQYSSDLFVASGLVLMALVVAERGVHGRLLWIWGAAAAVGVWLSHPAVLVVVACGAGLVVGPLQRRDWRGINRLVWATLPSAVSFTALYVVSLRALARDETLRTFWAPAMAPMPLTVHGLVVWLGRVIPALYSNPGDFALPILAIALSVAGGFLLATRFRGPAGVVVAALLGVATLTAVADRYPLSGRLALYLLLAMLLPMAALIDWAIGRVRTRPALALPSLVLVAVVASSAITGGVKFADHPFSTPDSRAALQFIDSHRRPGDQVWVQWPEVPVAQYYARTVGVDPDHEVDDGTGSGSGGCGGQTLTEAAAGGRVWLVVGYRLSTAGPHERQAIVDAFAHQGTLIGQIARRGAAAYLFDFGGDARRTASPSGLECLVVQRLSPVAPSGLHTGPLGWGKKV